jgi:hypothetical protein
MLLLLSENVELAARLRHFGKPNEHHVTYSLGGYLIDLLAFSIRDAQKEGSRREMEDSSQATRSLKSEQTTTPR